MTHGKLCIQVALHNLIPGSQGIMLNWRQRAKNCGIIEQSVEATELPVDTLSQFLVLVFRGRFQIQWSNCRLCAAERFNFIIKLFQFILFPVDC